MDINYNYRCLKQWNYLIVQKILIDKTKSGKNVSSLEVAEVVLVKCKVVDNQYQQKSEVLHTLMSIKSYDYLLNIEPSNLVFWKLIALSLIKLS